MNGFEKIYDFIITFHGKSEIRGTELWKLIYHLKIKKDLGNVSL